MSYDKTIEDLQNWLDGKYVSPQIFKDSLKQALYYLKLYESAVNEDDATKTRLLEKIEQLEQEVIVWKETVGMLDREIKERAVEEVLTKIQKK